jgi:hypothetical protein
MWLLPVPEASTPWLWLVPLPAVAITGFLGTKELLSFLAGHFALDTARRRVFFAATTVGAITAPCVLLFATLGGLSGWLVASLATMAAFVLGALVAVLRISPPTAPRVEVRPLSWLIMIPLAAGAIALLVLMSDPFERQLGSENARACDEIRAGRPAEAATILATLLETVEKRSPSLGAVRARSWRALVEYNLACACSKGGQRKEALDWLERAVGSGYRDWVWMDQDPDLDQIRREPRFVEIQTRWRAKH